MKKSTHNKATDLPPWKGGPRTNTIVNLDTGKTEKIRRKPLDPEQLQQCQADFEEANEILSELEGGRRPRGTRAASAGEQVRRGRVRIELVLSPDDERVINYLLNWQGSTRTSIAAAALSRGLRKIEEQMKSVFG